MSNIVSYSFSLPQFIVEEKVLSPNAKKGSRSICYVDEDIITLSYEAASNCITNLKDTVDAIFFATSTPVFKNRYHASFLADLLNISKEITALDFGGSPRSGTDALIMAHQLVEANVHRNILVVASDVQFAGIGNEARNSTGHAAAALIIGKQKGKAEINLAKSFSSAIAEEFTYKNTKVLLDPRFSRDAGFKSNLNSALEKTNIKPAGVDAVILNSLYAKIAGGLFFAKGFEEKQFAKDSISFVNGNTGAAHALLQLIDVLETGKKNILLFDYFNGTNVLEIKSGNSLGGMQLHAPQNDRTHIKTYQDYLSIRKAGNFNSNKYEPLEMFSSEMMNEREKEAARYLNVYECSGCKTSYFIKSAVCKKCGSNKFGLKKLQKTGTVFSYTREHYFPHSFAPVTMAIIDLDGGGRITVQLTDDMYPEEKEKLKIGSKVKLVMRKMMENSARPDYFWKCKLI